MYLGGYTMSIYILEDYILYCKDNKIKPTWYGLKEYKEVNWRD